MISVSPGPDEFLVAKASLAVSIMLLALRIGATLAASDEGLISRLVIAAVAFASLGMGLVEGLRWVDVKQVTTAARRDLVPANGSSRPEPTPTRDDSGQRGSDAQKVVERAYLAVDQIHLQGLDDGMPARVHFKIFNRSRTPAKRIESFSKAGVYEKMPVTPDYDNPIILPPIDLAPGGDINVISDQLQLTSAMVHNVQARTHSLHYWGRITYVDVFGDRHQTGYGFTFDPEVNKFRVTDVQGYNYPD